MATAFKIPGVPVTPHTPFKTMHAWQWAATQDRYALSIAAYLASCGFVQGEHTITTEEHDCLRHAFETYARIAPHMPGEFAFGDLFTESERGYYVVGRKGRYMPSQALFIALERSGWVVAVSPDTTYFEEINGVLWAKYQTILGSRPMAQLKAPPAVHVVGRRWFRPSNGSTYHTVAISIDGQPVHKSGVTYGYDEHYRRTAEEWLKANGIDPHGMTTEVHDVPRKRDL